MARSTVYVRGLDQLVRDFRKMEKSLAKEVTTELKEAGDIVRDDEKDYLSGIGASSKSIGGIRTQVRTGNVKVQQRYGTVTGKRGDWGARVQASLYVSADKRMPDVETRLGRMIDRLAGHNGF